MYDIKKGIEVRFIVHMVCYNEYTDYKNLKMQ